MATTLTALVYPTQGSSNVQTNAIIANQFSTLQSYVPGDYVIYNKTLYRCLDSLSPGAWDATKWTNVLIGDELKRLSSSGPSTSVSVGYITIYANSWSNDSIATQQVVVEDATITEYSKVDLQPTDVQLAELMNQGIFWLGTKNENGTLYVYSIGAYPDEDMRIQCTITNLQ